MNINYTFMRFVAATFTIGLYKEFQIKWAEFLLTV
jgi:hypothetical protein